VSLRKEQIEADRARANDDGKFYGAYLYFFELRVPGKLVGSPRPSLSLVYPLALNPESYSIDDPFTMQATPGTNGGLVVEENGIIQRTIRLSGTTGFAPRPLGASAKFEDLKPGSRSYVDRGKFLQGVLSGQRHFQFLQDKVFRTYADLKRDPTHAKSVEMHFHNIKDDEHWLVIPENFSMTRRAFLYHYDIALLAVAPSNSTPFARERKAQKKGFWENAKDAIAAARRAIAKIAAYAEIVTDAIDTVKRVVSDVVNVINEAINLVNVVSRIINGIARATADVFNRIRSIATTLRRAAVSIASAIGNFPATIAQAFHAMADEFHSLGTKQFFNELGDRVKAPLARLSRSRVVGQTLLTPGQFSTTGQPIRTTADLQRVGSAPTLADIVERLNSSNLGVALPTFTSLELYEVGSSDTLPSISSRFLGSADLWWVIAEANNLSHPYISDVPLPGTIRRGATLLVPATAAHSNALGPSGVVTNSNEEVASQLLFRDAKLVTSSRFPNRLDLALDPVKGNRDVVYVEGIDNLKQAMRTRIETELGESVLFPDLGMPQIVGLGEPIIDVEMVRVFIGQAISADNRIANLGSVRVSNTNSPDFYEIAVDARVRGYNAPVTINAIRSV
jgi:hypothetical protein